jgi:GT2 family glycosyltransferase
VVDNGPSPSLHALRDEYPGVVWLHQPSPGSYAARNLGIAHSRATYLAFTDADCIPAGDWLESGLDYFTAHPGSRVLGGPVEVFPKGDRPNWVEAYEMAVAFPVKQYIDRQHFAPTANLMVERTMFDEVGLFREDLLSGGDGEWGKRATGSGICIHFVPEQVVRHPARPNLLSVYRKSRRTISGHVRIAERETPKLVRLRRRCRALMPPVGPTRAIWTSARTKNFSVLWKLRIAAVFLAVHYFRTFYGLYRELGLGRDPR